MRSKGAQTGPGGTQALYLTNAPQASLRLGKRTSCFCARPPRSSPAFIWRTGLAGEELLQLLVLGSGAFFSLAAQRNRLLDQPKPTQANRVWVSDITCLPLASGQGVVHQCPSN